MSIAVDGKLVKQKYFENDSAIYEIDCVYQKSKKKEAIMIYFPRKEKYKINFVYE